MNIILFDDESIHDSFFPLSETRSIASLRCGILTLAEKWQMDFNANISIISQDYLQFNYAKQQDSIDFYIKVNVLPTEALLVEINNLACDESLWYNGELIVYRHKGFVKKKQIYDVLLVLRPWDLLEINGTEIEKDIKRLDLNPSNGKAVFTTLYGEKNIYIDDSANVKSAVINAEKGSVYIGPKVTVSEGCILKGPLAILEGAEVTMGAKLRNSNTIGPHSVIGGELKNVIIQGYSNKGHEGYIGDSFVGEWVNLGANTNCSNLNNNYLNIKVWDKASRSYIDSSKWKLGSIIGDFVHTGISTMLNSGTTIGVGCNVFGAGYQPKYLPNFTWGTNGETYIFDKFIKMATKLKSLKGESLTEKEISLLKVLSR